MYSRDGKTNVLLITKMYTPVVPLFSTPKLPKKVLKKGVNVDKKGETALKNYE